MKEHTFDFIRRNKAFAYMQKKNILKHSDPVSCVFLEEQTYGVIKSIAKPEVLNEDKFNVLVVLNTTNIMDSHDDVHMPGIWNKSLKERKLLYLLQEHQMRFDKIISDDIRARVEMMEWKELGFDYTGTTQALLFDATIEKERNAYMAEQYAKGRVRNHSVSMQYVKIELALNSTNPADKEEKNVWDKYIDKIVNRELAEEKGYFWAVFEAKLIEGSAVPLGSNYTTPTIYIGKQPSEEQPTEITVSQEVITASKKTGWELFNFKV